MKVPEERNVYGKHETLVAQAPLGAKCFITDANISLLREL